MKLILLPVLLTSLFFGSCHNLNAQEEGPPTAILEGKVQDFESLPGGRQIRCLVFQLTSFRPEMIRTQVRSDGSFRLEVPVYYFQEVWLQYLGKTIPLLVGPDEQVELLVDARRLSGNNHPWATVEVTGGHAESNRHLLTYLGNFPYRIEEADRSDGRLEPKAYKEEVLTQLDASLEELKTYRRGHFMNDTAYAWAVQDLRYTTARNLHAQVRWRATETGEEHLMKQLIAEGYFDVWESFRTEEPDYLLSWAYHQFLTSNILFLEDKMTLAFAPDFAAMEEPSRKEFFYVYGDSITMAGIEYLIDRPPSGFRDHALAVYCGNFLQFKAPAIQLSYVMAIRDDELRQRIREKYDQSRSKEVELENPALLVTPPDTVRDIVAWTGQYYENQIVLLDFWAVWCGSCLYSIENELPELVEQFKEDPVVFLLVGVASEKNFLIERANRFPVETLHLFPNARQEAVLQSEYELAGLPRYILLGRNGEVTDERAPGPGAELAARITELLND